MPWQISRDQERGPFKTLGRMTFEPLREFCYPPHTAAIRIAGVQLARALVPFEK